jgi:uncharacterized delta-60 repeat protein
VVASAGWSDADREHDRPGLVTSWGKDGVVQLPGFEVKQTIEDPSGRIVAVGNYKGNYAEVVRLLANGSLDSSFGKDGVVRWPFHMFQDRFPNGMDYLGWDLAALLPDGRIALAGTNMIGIVDEKATLIVSELDQNGRVVKTFGQNGYFTADKRLYDCSKIGNGCMRQFYVLARKKTTCTRGPAGPLAIQGDKIILSADRFCAPYEPHRIVVLRLNANGTLDRSFGKRGKVAVSVNGTLVYDAPLVAFPDGHLVVAETTPKGGMVRLTGLLRNGGLDRRFGRKGAASTRVTSSDFWGLGGISALLADRKGNISIAGANEDGPFLVRFYRSGKPNNFWTRSPWTPPSVDRSNYENFGGKFGPAGVAFAQLSNGELAAAAALLERIRPDGVLDPSYPPQHVYGAGKLITGGLLAASDGTVIVTLLKYHTGPGTYTTYLARYR